MSRDPWAPNGRPVKKWPSGLLPAVACQPATCGGNRKDLRASHTHGRTHDPIRQPYAHTRRVSHIPSIQQHMCTFLQIGPTMRVFTFLNTVDTMHKTRASDRTRSTSRASHAFFRARIVDRRPILQHSCYLQRSLGFCIPFTASSSRRTWWSIQAVQYGLSFIYTPTGSVATFARARAAAAAAACAQCVLAAAQPIVQVTRHARMPATCGCPPRADAG